MQDRIADGRSLAQPPEQRRIPLWRALGEILAVYVPSFGLGILSALMLLHNPSLGEDQITGPVSALEEILQYVMQASVTIFGVAFFCLQRGVTLRTLFGRLVEPQQYPPSAYGMPYPQPYAQPYPPQYPQPQNLAAQPAAWGYGYYMPPRPPTQRGRGWQFTRAYVVSMAGVLGFLLSVIIYTAVSNTETGAPSQGSSLYLLPVGFVVALSAGFGEEMLVTGLTVNALESAGMVGKRAWVIYLVAVCLRIPFHLYYGWASLGVIIFTVVNIWVYRRWRLLWPIILAHATYDFIEYAASVAPNAVGGLLILGLGFATLAMVIVVLCIEISDRGSRRRYAQYNAAAHAAYAAQTAYEAQNQIPVPPVLPVEPPETGTSLSGATAAPERDVVFRGPSSSESGTNPNGPESEPEPEPEVEPEPDKR